MTHQEASTVLAMPLALTEQRLRDVESWSHFLLDVREVRQTSHERYEFELVEGRRVPMVVRFDPRRHRFSWHALAGPPFEGCLRLSALNGDRTQVTLELTWQSAGFMANLREMLGGGTDTARLDLQRLESQLTHRHVDLGQEEVARRA